MRVLRRTDYPEGRFTNTFVGYGPEQEFPAIELTCNWDRTEPYDKGEAFGHLALEVADVSAFCERVVNAGARMVRAPGPMRHGTRVMAFLEDPDGNRIEVSEPVQADAIDTHATRQT
jgi:lactoylglutathione lyase